MKQAMVAAKRAAAEEKSAAVGPKAAKPAATRKPRAPAKPKVVLPARRSGRLAGADAPTMVKTAGCGCQSSAPRMHACWNLCSRSQPPCLTQALHVSGVHALRTLVQSNSTMSFAHGLWPPRLLTG